MDEEYELDEIPEVTLYSLLNYNKMKQELFVAYNIIYSVMKQLGYGTEMKNAAIEAVEAATKVMKMAGFRVDYIRKELDKKLLKLERQSEKEQEATNE